MTAATRPVHQPAAGPVPAWSHVNGHFEAALRGLLPSPAAAAAAVHAGDAIITRIAGDRWQRREVAGEAPHLRVIGAHAQGTAIGEATAVDLLVMLTDDAVRAAGSSRRAVRRLTGRLQPLHRQVQPGGDGWIVLPPRRERLAGREVALPAVRLLPVRSGGNGTLIPLLPGAGDDRRLGAIPLLAPPHPQAQAAHLASADQVSGGKARALIRLLKAWRDANGIALSGFMIELLACKFVSLWLYRRRSALFSDWMVRDGFFWLAAQPGRQLPIPGSHGVLTVAGGWEAHAHHAYRLASAAADAERDNDRAAALALWRQIFGAGFGAEA
jgi:hypothetical protein